MTAAILLAALLAAPAQGNQQSRSLPQIQIHKFRIIVLMNNGFHGFV